MTNHYIENSNSAITILKDTSFQEFRREQAVRYLQDHPSAEGIEALIEALADDDYGVHWACGTAVAFLGEQAFHIYLEALAKPDHSSRLREITGHIIHTNSSESVRQDGQSLLKAVKGPAAAIAAIEEANKLMLIYR